MADAPPPGVPAQPERPLTAEEITYLHALGQVFHHARGYLAPQDALDTALRAAGRLRHTGAAWDSIVDALGIPEDELRQRRSETTDKPHSPERTTPPPARLTTDWGNARRFTVAGTSVIQAHYSTETFSISQTEGATIHSYAPFEATGTATATTRIVLFLSGDPRPGQNDFGAEVALVRDTLIGSAFEVFERTSVALPEICPALDRYRPAVLHIAAHSEFGGVRLVQGEDRLVIDHTLLSEQIARARHPPRIAVLNVCDSSDLGEAIAGTVGAVVSWPHTLTDGQAQAFSAQLYRSLLNHRSFQESCKDAEAALAGPHPGCPPPVLHGDGSLHLR
ncbi:hypothetical protein [Kitasatospora sp. NBC_00458]|uniref:hypothetical protein n=1 Tax=Kitasatospora sp. NBC_00458 TaxID=2903568 RepID=UPI002E176712